jgi:hypothetical protein
LGQDFSGLLSIGGGEELEGTLIEGAFMEGMLMEGTLTAGAEVVGALMEGALKEGGPVFLSLIERLSMGIRSSSRGSGGPLFDFGAAGKGLTTPVLQKSFLFVGLELLS